MRQLSLTTSQEWADKTHADRVAWFAFHGEDAARARGAFVIAVEAYARAIKQTGANERVGFSADRFIESVLDVADAQLAAEVRAYLGA